MTTIDRHVANLLGLAADAGQLPDADDLAGLPDEISRFVSAWSARLAWVSVDAGKASARRERAEALDGLRALADSLGVSLRGDAQRPSTGSLLGVERPAPDDTQPAALATHVPHA